MVEFGMNPDMSSNLLATGSPQWRLNSMYPGNPKSLPRCMLNDTRSKPNLFPGFLIRLLVTSRVIESSIAWATWFIRPIKYSSMAPARYRSNGRRIKSDSFLEAERNRTKRVRCKRHWMNYLSCFCFTIYTDKTVCFAPTFNGVWQEGMTKTKSSCRKRSKYTRIYVGIVSVPISLKFGMYIAWSSKIIKTKY